MVCPSQPILINIDAIIVGVFTKGFSFCLLKPTVVVAARRYTRVCVQRNLPPPILNSNSDTGRHRHAYMYSFRIAQSRERVRSMLQTMAAQLDDADGSREHAKATTATAARNNRNPSSSAGIGGTATTTLFLGRPPRSSRGGNDSGGRGNQWKPRLDKGTRRRR